jgi:hypothetical protein
LERKWRFKDKDLGLDLSYRILYNPLQTDQFAFQLLSISPSLYPVRVARRVNGLEIGLDPISEKEVGFFL